MKRNTFIGENFMLQNDTARRLYHDYAREMPLIDYHCHLPVNQIDEDRTFDNLTDIWLRGDHYKWRAMRTLGVDERYITGDATDEEKFRQWAAMAPYTVRSPLFHWTQMELKDPFGVENLLCAENASAIYAHCNTLLQKPEYSARGLLSHFRVTTVCTTDDPCDDLRHHAHLATSNFTTQVFPAFRPDKVLQLDGGDAFRAYLDRLGEAAALPITGLDTLLEALARRVDYFHDHGGRLSDHGLNYIPRFDAGDPHRVEKDLAQVLQGGAVTPEARDNYAGFVLFHLCRMYHRKGWVQQFHLGALRNTNTRKLGTFGPDTGFDSIGDYPQAVGMAALFDKLEQTEELTKTILYNVNPADNEVFASMVGNFNEGPSRGKIQFGAAWWFMDQLDGMEKQINALSQIGILSCFVGMLTDSRSFLSYSRHEYFRRLLCNIFGKDIEAGYLPDDEKWIGSVIQDICYHNARQYFDWP
jgi:glucuronate isomerase